MQSQQQNVPNAGRRTVDAYMRTKSFISPSNPTPKQIEEFDNEMSSFLETIDNQKRYLNGRNSFAVGDKIFTLVWYLEAIPDKPVTTPFGAKEQNDETNTSEKK